MPPRARVHHAHATAMRIGQRVFPVVHVHCVATKAKTTAIESIQQVHVECDIGIIDVHVQGNILVFTVLDQEGMVMVERPAAAIFEQQRSQWAHVVLKQFIEQSLQADVVQNEAVIVHRIGAWLRKSASFVCPQLCNKDPAERVRKHGKGKHSVDLLVYQCTYRLQSIACCFGLFHCLSRGPKFGSKPVRAPPTIKQGGRCGLVSIAQCGLPTFL
mmetsp:Transcript_95371/g.269652  ORF Transcript_95371/g.269652 Transcript_95371/m.269652 type:complete len:215 (+) Transcript_95371:264-908(+)